MHNIPLLSTILIIILISISSTNTCMEKEEKNQSSTWVDLLILKYVMPKPDTKTTNLPTASTLTFQTTHKNNELTNSTNNNKIHLDNYKWAMERYYADESNPTSWADYTNPVKKKQKKLSVL